MVEPETVLEPETNFEQSDPELDALAEQLYDEGFDEEDIEEALYDPAPRRRRGRRHRRARAYDPRRRSRGRRSHRRAYDPAPRKYRPRRMRRRLQIRKGVRRAKGALAKFRKFVLPGTFAASFYLSYSANAKARGLSIMDALKADIANWDINKVGNKLQTNPYPVAVTVGGVLAKKFVPGANRGMLGLAVDAAIGIAGGQLATQLVDEPAAPLRSAARAMEQKQVIMQVGQNPYM